MFESSDEVSFNVNRNTFETEVNWITYNTCITKQIN